MLLLSEVGWADGISATFLVIFFTIFGIYLLFESKTKNFKLLIVLGFTLIFCGFLFLYRFLDFMFIIIEGGNIDIIYVPIIGWVWIAPLTISVMYIASMLLKPERKSLILSIYILLGIVYEIILFVDTENSAFIDLPDFPGQKLYDANFEIFTPCFLMVIIFVLSICLFFGIGILIKAINSPKEIKKKFSFLSTGVFLLIIFILLDALIPLSPLIILFRSGIIVGVFFIYFGLMPKKVKKEKTKRPTKSFVKLASFLLGKTQLEEDLDESVSTNVELDRSILVFASYATKDIDNFKIHEIVKNLNEFPEIKNVLYWEEYLADNIFEYMNETIEKCDIMILFCSEHALNSIPVKKEWTAAEAIGLPIIPIFSDINHIPTLLKSRLGLEYDYYDEEKNIHGLRDLILKKLGENVK